jgi:hypothetical protein
MKKMKDQLPNRGSHICSMCGSQTEILELAHTIPISQGGTDSTDNLSLVCANCHRLIDSGPTEIHFISYLARLLQRHPAYQDVKVEAPLSPHSRYYADIETYRRVGLHNERLVIECRQMPVLSARHLGAVLKQLDNYLPAAAGARMILAFPGRTSEENRQILARRSVEVWDIPQIFKLFSTEIASIDDPYYGPKIAPPVTTAG